MLRQPSKALVKTIGGDHMGLMDMTKGNLKLRDDLMMPDKSHIVDEIEQAIKKKKHKGSGN